MSGRKVAAKLSSVVLKTNKQLSSKWCDVATLVGRPVECQRISRSRGFHRPTRRELNRARPEGEDAVIESFTVGSQPLPDEGHRAGVETDDDGQGCEEREPGAPRS